MSSYHLRTAIAADIPALQTLIEASVRTLQVADYSLEQIERAARTIFTVDTQLVQDGTYFVIETDDGALAACGGWSRRKTLYGGDRQMEAAESGLLHPVHDAARIRAIFVHPSHARHGLGSWLLRSAEEAAFAEGFRRLEMGSTLTGYPLYLRKGYVEFDRIMAPVGDGYFIQVVKMSKSLKEK